MIIYTLESFGEYAVLEVEHHCHAIYTMSVLLTDRRGMSNLNRLMVHLAAAAETAQTISASSTPPPLSSPNVMSNESVM